MSEARGRPTHRQRHSAQLSNPPRANSAASLASFGLLRRSVNFTCSMSRAASSSLPFFARSTTSASCSTVIGCGALDSLGTLSLAGVCFARPEPGSANRKTVDAKRKNATSVDPACLIRPISRATTSHLQSCPDGKTGQTAQRAASPLTHSRRCGSKGERQLQVSPLWSLWRPAVEMTALA